MDRDWEIYERVSGRGCPGGIGGLGGGLTTGGLGTGLGGGVIDTGFSGGRGEGGGEVEKKVIHAKMLLYSVSVFSLALIHVF